MIMNQYDALVIAKQAIDYAITNEVAIDGITDGKAVIEHMIEVKNRSGSNGGKTAENAAKAAEFAQNWGGETFTSKDVADYFDINSSKATAIIRAGKFEKVYDDAGNPIKTDKRMTYTL